jgi:hypothetical protein
LLATVIIYAAIVSASPDFELGLVRYMKPAALIEDVTISRECNGGNVLIKASRMRPGHDKVRGLLVGPSSFVALEDLEVRVVGAGKPNCVVKGETGKLTPRALTVLGNPTLEIHGVPPPACTVVTIDLRTASVLFR